MRRVSRQAVQSVSWVIAPLQAGFFVHAEQSGLLELGSGLLFRNDAERFHFPIKIAAFQTKQLGRAGDVAAGFVQRFEDIFFFSGGSDFMQTAETFHGTLEHGASSRN